MQAFIPSIPVALPCPHTTHPVSRARQAAPPCTRRAHRTHLAPAACSAPPDAPPDSPPPVPLDASPDAQTDVPRDVPFEIRGFSLANVGLLLGGSVTLYSFSSYFGSNATASATSLGFVYGVPILLIGCALKYAELQPIALVSTPGARAARTKAATDIQRKIVSDVTRHRYGDEAHLAAALAALGLQPRGEPCPELVGAEEAVGAAGEYRLKLLFRSVATPWKEWQDKIERYERFFGPGVTAEVEKVDSEQRLVALTLASVVALPNTAPSDEQAADAVPPAPTVSAPTTPEEQ